MAKRHVWLAMLSLCACAPRSVAGVSENPQPSAPARFEGVVDRCAWAPDHFELQRVARAWLAPYVDATCEYGAPMDGAGDIILTLNVPHGDLDPIWFLNSAGSPQTIDARGRATARMTGFSIGNCWESESGPPGAAGVLTTFAADGGSVGTAVEGATANCQASPDPSGGFTFVTSSWPPHDGERVSLSRIDGQGQARYASIDVGRSDENAPTWFQAQTDARDHTLLRWYPPDGLAHARWLDGAGQPSGDDFDGWPFRYLDLSPLIGGGFAARNGDRFWVGVVPDDGQSVLPLPNWLAARAASGFAIDPSGLGYIVFDAVDDGAPGTLSFVAADGEDCGTLVTPGYGATAVPDGTFTTEENIFAGDGGVTCEVSVWRRVRADGAAARSE